MKIHKENTAGIGQQLSFIVYEVKINEMLMFNMNILRTCKYGEVRGL
jgi:hypothetical protein